MPGKRFWVKIHHSKAGETVVAACDEDLLGTSLRVGEGFSVEVSRSFYGGILVEEGELERYLRQATIINLLGDSVVSYALSRGMVVKRAVVKVGGVSHVQLYL